MKTNWLADLAIRAAAVFLAPKAEIFQKAILQNNLMKWLCDWSFIYSYYKSKIKVILEDCVS